MIDHLKYATASLIAERKLKYYEDFRGDAERLAFCDILGISFLPSNSKTECYHFSETSGFKKVELAGELCCNPYDRIFDKSFINRFKENGTDEVLFLVDEGKIRGVIHIVDYNSSILFFEFYKLFHHMEKSLRLLLCSKGLDNAAFIEWVRHKSETSSSKGYWQNRLSELWPDNESRLLKAERKRRDCAPFQTFNFKELVQFAIDKGVLGKPLSKKLELLGSLRNRLAHNHEIVSKKDNLEDGILYNYSGLEQFVEEAHAFFEFYEELVRE